MKLLEEDEKTLNELATRYNISDLLVHLYWIVVDKKNNYVKNNPYGHVRRERLIDLANKIDESSGLAVRIGE